MKKRKIPSGRKNRQGATQSQRGRLAREKEGHYSAQMPFGKFLKKTDLSKRGD